MKYFITRSSDYLSSHWLLPCLVHVLRYAPEAELEASWVGRGDGKTDIRWRRLDQLASRLADWLAGMKGGRGSIGQCSATQRSWSTTLDDWYGAATSKWSMKWLPGLGLTGLVGRNMSVLGFIIWGMTPWHIRDSFSSTCIASIWSDNVYPAAADKYKTGIWNESWAINQ